MSTKVIRPEQFEEALKELLQEYGEEAYDICEASAKSAARSAAKDLKGSAPSGGSYARGWSHKAQKNGTTQYSDTVYNRTDYQLTHLLEKSHPTGGGGQYPKNVNYTGTIARVEEKYTKEFFEEVKAKL